MHKQKTNATPNPAGEDSNLIDRLLKSPQSLFPLFKKDYTYISSGVTLRGDIIADENVVLDGQMNGNIRSSKHVSLGSSSHFEGTIESESALISGHVKGSIKTKRTLEVKVPATIVGDLISASVKVESGVLLHGKIVSNPKQEQQTDHNVREEVFATLVEPVEGK